jgi:hypothetical protein
LIKQGKAEIILIISNLDANPKIKELSNVNKLQTIAVNAIERVPNKAPKLRPTTPAKTHHPSSAIKSPKLLTNMRRLLHLNHLNSLRQTIHPTTKPTSQSQTTKEIVKS